MHGLLLQLQGLDPTTRWLLIGAAALTIFYAVMRPLKRRKDPLARSPGSASLASQRSVEREMSNLLVELSEMARQITAQLDTRAAKLELLIKEADERLADMDKKLSELSAAVHGSRPPGAAPNGSGDAERGGGREVVPAIDPRHGEVYALADAGRTLKEIAHQLNRPDGEIELILALRAR